MIWFGSKSHRDDNPFLHVVIDEWGTPELLRAANAEWPTDNWQFWHRYENQKLATKDPLRFPPAVSELMRQLHAMPIEKLTGIAGTFPDLSCHGAGMHTMPVGSKLGVHLDGDHHPQTGWKRMLSALLFLNEEWHSNWGGALELWDATGKTCVKRIEPKFNRLVLFATGDTAYHGVTDPIRCPGGIARRSLAAFWWSLSPSESKRPRAEFV